MMECCRCSGRNNYEQQPSIRAKKCDEPKFSILARMEYQVKGYWGRYKPCEFEDEEK